MAGAIPAHGHRFCGEHCIRTYEKEHGIGEGRAHCPSCAVKKGVPWYREKLFIVGMTTLLLLAVSFAVAELNPFFDAFMDYLALIWWAVILGFVVGGIIDYFIPRRYIEKYLARHRKRTVGYAIVFGFLMSACSHGILAIAMELYKKGANTSATIAFLLASPWANLPITVLLFGFFGMHALLVIASALIVAATTGLIYQRLERAGVVECQQCERGEDRDAHTDFSVVQDIRCRLREFEPSAGNVKQAIAGTVLGGWSLAKMVLWWLLVGLLMAAFARAYVPHDLFMEYMGPTVLGLFVTLFFATIIEVCSEGSSPLAFEIFEQTGAFGNSFTFLMAGVATDYTEIGLIWQNIGKKAALFLPLVTVPQIVILGILFNAFA
jgi:hypothetical protein